jgi:hypothetical protein
MDSSSSNLISGDMSPEGAAQLSDKLSSVFTVLATGLAPTETSRAVDTTEPPLEHEQETKAKGVDLSSAPLVEWPDAVSRSKEPLEFEPDPAAPHPLTRLPSEEDNIGLPSQAERMDVLEIQVEMITTGIAQIMNELKMQSTRAEGQALGYTQLCREVSGLGTRLQRIELAGRSAPVAAPVLSVVSGAKSSTSASPHKADPDEEEPAALTLEEVAALISSTSRAAPRSLVLKNSATVSASLHALGVKLPVAASTTLIEGRVPYAGQPKTVVLTLLKKASKLL